MPAGTCEAICTAPDSRHLGTSTAGRAYSPNSSSRTAATPSSSWEGACRSASARTLGCALAMAYDVPGPLQHREVVGHVPEGDHLVRGHAQLLAEQRQRARLGDAGAADLHQRAHRGPGRGDQVPDQRLGLRPELLGVALLVPGEQLDRVVGEDRLERRRPASRAAARGGAGTPAPCRSRWCSPPRTPCRASPRAAGRRPAGPRPAGSAGRCAPRGPRRRRRCRRWSRPPARGRRRAPRAAPSSAPGGRSRTRR